MCSVPCASVQKESVLGVLHYPFEAFLKVQSSQCTALHNVPPVRVNRVELQGLRRLSESVRRIVLGKHWDPAAAGKGTTNLAYLFRAHASCNIAFVLEHEKTGSHQSLSFWSASTLSDRAEASTSCTRSPSSSCRQSSIRSRSVPSTTHMSVSVFSK
jgi:hypothetical protein